MKTYLTLLFLTFNIFANCQDNLYWFNDHIEKKIIQDTTKNKSWRSQMGATYYSISNNYKKALESWDLTFGRNQKLSIQDSLSILKLNPANAKDYILNQAEKEQIIILNEAHHNASHRNFASSLLQGLYNKGYRYLGIETLKSDDSLNIRKYAVLNSGFYSQEPQFGAFINKALKIGFILFPYEADGNGKEREIGQAKNIHDFMQNNKNGKYFIYCGYEHAYEGTHPTWEKTMAGRLTDLTGINPLTIDQTKYSEKSKAIYTNPLVRIFNKKNPTVLIDDLGNPYNGGSSKTYTDISIVNSFTKYKKGKPNWMLNNEKKLYKIPKSKIKNYPILVLAYKKGQYSENGIPEDITEIENSSSPKYLVLGKGDYEIIIKDSTYKVIDKFEVRK